MRALVSGGAGFIGSHIVDALLAEGWEVAVLDDLSTGRREFVPGGVRCVVSDLSSTEASAFVEEWRPDVLLHQAAHVSVRESVEDPITDAQTNVLGSLSLFEACRRAGTRQVVFASTGGAMYGASREFPTPESEPATPLSPYGSSKLAVEGYLGYFARVHGVIACSLRYANVYGPRQSPHGEAGIVAIFAERYLRGQPPIIHGDGSQTRDYVHVEDVASAALAALKARLEGVYNVGTGIETSVLEVSARIRDAVRATVAAVHGPAKEGDAARSSLDANRLRSAVAWSPRIPFSQGIPQTVEWFRRHRP